MIRLTAVIELDGQSPRALTYESNATSFVLGRDDAADFQIPLSTVSREHARIADADGAYVIEDLRSTHGTIVNDRKLDRGEKKVLRDGDVITLTKAKITCHIETDAVVTKDPHDDGKEVASRAVEGILGRMGEAKSEGPFLRVLNGPEEGQRFYLKGAQTLWGIGRSKDCDLVLNDPNVSRRHTEIKRDWSGYVVHDMGSKNGVLINEKRIRKPRRLKDQDEIIVGPIKLLFIDPDAELLAALKDVPGFELDEPEEQPDEMERDSSVLGGPSDGQSGAGENPMESEDDDLGFDEELPEPEPAPESMPDDDGYEASLAAIDPDLLAEDKGSGFEWLIGPLAIVFAGGAGFLLYLIYG